MLKIIGMSATVCWSQLSPALFLNCHVLLLSCSDDWCPRHWLFMALVIHIPFSPGSTGFFEQEGYLEMDRNREDHMMGQQSFWDWKYRVCAWFCHLLHLLSIFLFVKWEQSQQLPILYRWLCTDLFLLCGLSKLLWSASPLRGSRPCHRYTLRWY